MYWLIGALVFIQYYPEIKQAYFWLTGEVE